MSIEEEKAGAFGFFNSLTRSLRRRLKPLQVHDYTCCQNGVHYVFEVANDGTRGCMTGQGKGIEPGHQILIELQGISRRYEVEAIEYYASPSDLWIASLSEIE